MVIELGTDGFISFQAKLEPERLILVVTTGHLVRTGIKPEPLQPNGTFHYQDQMRGHVPSFCLHPESEPDTEDADHVVWTWFSDTESGFWAIDLIRHKDDSWGCGLTLNESETQDDTHEVFSVWVELPKYVPDHASWSEAPKIRDMVN